MPVSGTVSVNRRAPVNDCSSVSSKPIISDRLVLQLDHQKFRKPPSDAYTLPCSSSRYRQDSTDLPQRGRLRTGPVGDVPARASPGLGEGLRPAPGTRLAAPTARAQPEPDGRVEWHLDGDLPPARAPLDEPPPATGLRVGDVFLEPVANGLLADTDLLQPVVILVASVEVVEGGAVIYLLQNVAGLPDGVLPEPELAVLVEEVGKPHLPTFGDGDGGFVLFGVEVDLDVALDARVDHPEMPLNVSENSPKCINGMHRLGFEPRSSALFQTRITRNFDERPR